MSFSKVMLYILLVLTAGPTAAKASVDDIVSPGADLYIRVTRYENLRHFEICSKGQGTRSCRRLGRDNWYSVASLESQRHEEMAEAAGSVIATAALSAIALFTGFGATAFLVPVESNALFFLAEGVAVGGTGLGAAKFTTHASIGPVEQLKQQYLLRGAVINDEQIVLAGKNDRDITEISARLDLLLNKIR